MRFRIINLIFPGKQRNQRRAIVGEHTVTIKKDTKTSPRLGPSAAARVPTSSVTARGRSARGGTTVSAFLRENLTLMWASICSMTTCAGEPGRSDRHRGREGARGHGAGAAHTDPAPPRGRRLVTGADFSSRPPEAARLPDDVPGPRLATPAAVTRSPGRPLSAELRAARLQGEAHSATRSPAQSTCPRVPPSASEGGHRGRQDAQLGEPRCCQLGRQRGAHHRRRGTLVHGSSHETTRSNPRIGRNVRLHLTLGEGRSRQNQLPRQQRQQWLE